MSRRARQEVDIFLYVKVQCKFEMQRQRSQSRSTILVFKQVCVSVFLCLNVFICVCVSVFKCFYLCVCMCFQCDILYLCLNRSVIISDCLHLYVCLDCVSMRVYVRTCIHSQTLFFPPLLSSRLSYSERAGSHASLSFTPQQKTTTTTTTGSAFHPVLACDEEIKEIKAGRKQRGSP